MESEMQIEQGIARRSAGQPDPLIHILVGERAMWCTGGEGLRLNSVSRARCPRCTALLREGVRDKRFDESELDEWLSTTRDRRVFASR